MAECEEIELRLNVNKTKETRTTVWLIEHHSNSHGEQRKRRSGLVMIPNQKYVDQKVQTMKKDMKFLRATQSQTRESIREALELNETLFREYDNIDDCKAFLRRRPHKSVILMIFYPFAEDPNIVAEFKQPQISQIYSCVPHQYLDLWFDQRVSKSADSVFHRLPLTKDPIPIQSMDLPTQHAFSYLFFTELIQRLPRPADPVQVFLEFCKLKYENVENSLQYKREMEDFANNYNETKAILWYTKPKNFASRMIDQTCISLNYEVLPKISFLLFDIYMQLKKLHDEQLGTRLKSGLKVFRGKIMSKDELNQLKTEGNLFVTRSMVSASKNSEVAQSFCRKDGSNCVDESVLIAFQFDHVELEEKPIAFINELSQIPNEMEFLFPMGVVFRVQSCKTMEENGEHIWIVNMIRGEEEIKIEKDLSRFIDWTQTIGQGIFAVISHTPHVGSSGKDNIQIVSQIVSFSEDICI